MCRSEADICQEPSERTAKSPPPHAVLHGQPRNLRAQIRADGSAIYAFPAPDSRARARVGGVVGVSAALAVPVCQALVSGEGAVVTHRCLRVVLFVALCAGAGSAGAQTAAAVNTSPCSLSLLSHLKTVATIEENTPSLDPSLKVDGASMAFECTDPMTLHDRPGYAGTCFELHVTEEAFTQFAGGDFFPSGKAASLAFSSSRCGAQIILFENDHYNADQVAICSGFGCFPYMIGCYNGRDPGEPGCRATRAGKQFGVAVSDGGLTREAVPNGGTVPMASIASFDDFGASSLLMPSGGVAAVYDQPSFHGNCQELNPVFAYVDDLSVNQGLAVGNDTIDSVRLLRGCDPALYFFSGPLGDGNYFYKTTRDAPLLNGGAAAQSMSSALPDLYISVFSGVDYTGSCTTLAPNDGFNTQLLHDTRIGSVRVGAACQARGTAYLYPSARYGGTPLVLSASSADLGTASFDNVAASVVNSGAQPISLYADAAYGRSCLEVPAGSGAPDLATTFVGAGAVSSVKLGPCPPSAVLYTRSATTVGETPTTLTGNVPDVPAFIGSGKLASTISNKSTKTISLYTRTGYSGPCENVAPGRVVNLSVSNEVVGVSTLRSIKVTGPCPLALELFDATAFRGTYKPVIRTTQNLQTFAGTTTSLVNNTNGNVAVYTKIQRGGRCQNVAAGQGIVNLAGTIVGADAISSVVVGGTCKPQVFFFPKESYGGAFFGTSFDIADLSARPSAAKAVSFVNNAARTISLYSQPNYGGRCQNVAANTAIATLVRSVVHARAIRSLKVSGPCPAFVHLFAAAGFDGGRVFVTPAVETLGPIGFARKAVSIVNNTTGPVAVYGLVRFSGECEVVAPGEAISNLGAAGHIGAAKIVSLRRAAAC
jgi:hypothetical protein